MNFVFDIDGTLCFDGKTIAPNIIAALQRLLDDGHHVYFASARPIRDLLPVVPEHFHHCAMIGGNGTYTYANKQITITHFAEETHNILLAYIQRHHLAFLADSEWDFTYTGELTHPLYLNISQITAKNVPLHTLKQISKLVIFNPTDEIIQHISSLPVSVFQYKNEAALDISPFGINKVAGLRKLQVKDFIAFGNDMNDQCLFEAAVHSVCVGDHDVKAFATEAVQRTDVARKIQELSELYK